MSRAPTLLAFATLLAGVPCGTVVAAPPPVPETPEAVDSLLYARPFSVKRGFESPWSKERPIVKGGLILVIEFDPAYAYPRQSAEPVLYVGTHTAHRLSRGHSTGRMIVLAPGNIDLASSPIWFGSPELPERVDAAMALRERALADAAGIVPFSPAEVEAALERGGAHLSVLDGAALDVEIRRLYADFVAPHLPPDERRR